MELTPEQAMVMNNFKANFVRMMQHKVRCDADKKILKDLLGKDVKLPNAKWYHDLSKDEKEGYTSGASTVTGDGAVSTASTLSMKSAKAPLESVREKPAATPAPKPVAAPASVTSSAAKKVNTLSLNSILKVFKEAVGDDVYEEQVESLTADIKGLPADIVCASNAGPILEALTSGEVYRAVEKYVSTTKFKTAHKAKVTTADVETYLAADDDE